MDPVTVTPPSQTAVSDEKPEGPKYVLSWRPDGTLVADFPEGRRSSIWDDPNYVQPPSKSRRKAGYFPVSQRVIQAMPGFELKYETAMIGNTTTALRTTILRRQYAFTPQPVASAPFTLATNGPKAQEHSRRRGKPQALQVVERPQRSLKRRFEEHQAEVLSRGFVVPIQTLPRSTKRTRRDAEPTSTSSAPQPVLPMSPKSLDDGDSTSSDSPTQHGKSAPSVVKRPQRSLKRQFEESVQHSTSGSFIDPMQTMQHPTKRVRRGTVPPKTSSVAHPVPSVFPTYTNPNVSASPVSSKHIDSRRKCFSCHSQSSAQQTWRTGWKPHIVLCNQCGLRYNRNGNVHCSECNFIPTKSKALKKVTVVCDRCTHVIR